MKMNQEAQTVVRSGIKRSTECGMVVNAKAFEMLARQYSNPIKAILQEIGANAADSHIRASKSDAPFKVKLPNNLDNHLRIRDFGIGMSKDVIYNVYINYMKSDKTDTNEETGFFGIGSKTPLAYADSFNITTYNNGTMSMYSLGYNESGIPELNEFGDYPTDEEDGVEVSFAVKESDFGKFADSAQEVYSFFDTTPEITGNSRCQIKEKDKVLSGNNWYMRKVSWNDPSMVIMGNIAYPIEPLHISSSSYSCKYEQVLHSGFVVKVDMASLNITPSRESLEYTDLTIKTIRDAIDKAYPEIEEYVKKKLDACHSKWQAMIESKRLKRHLGYRLCESMDSMTKWRGDSFEFYKSQNLNVIRSYSLEQSKVKSRKQDVCSVPITANTKVVIKDIDSKFDSRSRYYCSETAYDVYLVDGDQLNSVMEKIGCIEDDGVVMMASDLEDAPKSETRQGVRGRRKKTQTLLKWSEGKWVEEEVDMSTGDNLYVMMRRNDTYDVEGSINVGRICSHLRNLGYDMPSVYAIKRPHLKRAERSSNWKTLRLWVIEQIKDKKTDPIFLEKLKNASTVDTICNSREYKTVFDKIESKINNKDTSLYKLLSYCSEHDVKSSEVDSFTNLCRAVSYGEGVDNVDMASIIEDVQDKYFLVIEYIGSRGSWYYETDKGSSCLEKVVHTVNALDSFKEN